MISQYFGKKLLLVKFIFINLFLRWRRSAILLSNQHFTKNWSVRKFFLVIISDALVRTIQKQNQNESITFYVRPFLISSSFVDLVLLVDSKGQCFAKTNVYCHRMIFYLVAVVVSLVKAYKSR